MVHRFVADGLRIDFGSRRFRRTAFSSGRLRTLVRGLLVGVALSGFAGSARPAHGLPPGALKEASAASGFPFGVAVDTDTTGARLALAASEFTSVTAENAMKWGTLSPSSGAYDFTAADAFVGWASAQGHRIRGHTLFWSRLNGMPGWLEAEVNASPDPQATLTQLMQAHASSVVGRYAGQIAQWDVVNEPLETLGPNLDPANFFFATLGESYLDIAFAAAHAADPNAQLFLNETVVEDFPQKLPGLVSLVQGLQSRGVPIHGVGLQGHFFFNPPDIEQLRADILALAALGVVVEFTEVDIRLPLFAGYADPLGAQAAAYQALTSLCVEIVACVGMTVWGVDDGDTWLDAFSLTAPDAPNQPLLFDAAQMQKPAYEAVVAGLQQVPATVPALSLAGSALALVALLVAGVRGMRNRQRAQRVRHRRVGTR